MSDIIKNQFVYVLKDGGCHYFALTNGKAFDERYFLSCYNEAKQFIFGGVYNIEYVIKSNKEIEFVNIEHKQQSNDVTLKNLYDAIKNYCLIAMKSDAEKNEYSVEYVNKCEFYIPSYFSYVDNLLNIFASFYNYNKIDINNREVVTNKNKALLQEFDNSTYDMYGKEPNKIETTYDFKGYVKTIRRKYFNFFTSTNKIINFMRDRIQNKAIQTLNLMYENYMNNEKNK